MARKRKARKIKFYLKLLLIIALFSYSIYVYGWRETFGLDDETLSTLLDVGDDNSHYALPDGSLSVQFLNVGEADAILIQTTEGNMLIDAGNNNDGPLLVQYFKELNIEQFDILVGTHPHEDHIGGLDDIIREFEIKKVYMPDVVTTTSTFLDVLDAIENKNLKISVPKIDSIWELGDAKIEVIYTGTDSNDLNNTSIVLRLIYGGVKILFTGDATASLEKEIGKKNISSDVLKVAHHGSPYSTTNEFLEACHPKYAVISVGKGNDYGHPGTSVLKKFKRENITVYRTDKQGTILLITDGKNIEFNSIKTNVDGG